jgi:hypothetical protein
MSFRATIEYPKGINEKSLEAGLAIIGLRDFSSLRSSK